MLKITCKLWLFFFLSIGCWLIYAQEKPPLGSLEVSGRVKIGKKQEKLQRKRFYLLRGGLKDNKTLIERLKASEIVSRDCYYSQMQASPEFICWLKEENCESPYCRQITDTDIKKVPEFQTAFQKGLRQFGRRRPLIAQRWLTTNLSSRLRDGYYQRQKLLLKDLLAGVEPVQSTMTDSVSVSAIFIDIPLNLGETGGKKKEAETFLVSNILPFEIGDKSYVWACEIGISSKKTAKMRLDVPTDKNPSDDCVVIVKDLPVCKTEGCQK